ERTGYHLLQTLQPEDRLASFPSEPWWGCLAFLSRRRYGLFLVDFSGRGEVINVFAAGAR
ncbi:MAG TPA: hypothetical protein VEI04_13800, partial [Syntrophobacteria bacterium]|nr:hypothetical protein [Syntrophobacteria bacterium]